MNSSRSSGRVALCGILTALSLVIMLISGLMGVLTLAAPMIVGGLLIAPVREYGTKTSLTMFAAVSLLGLILVTDKELVLIYLLFFGYYPIIQQYLDRIVNKPVRRGIKALIFNVGSILSVCLANIIFAVPIFEENEPVVAMGVLYIVLANFCFILYDKALRQFFTIYDIKVHAVVERFIK